LSLRVAVLVAALLAVAAEQVVSVPVQVYPLLPELIIQLPLVLVAPQSVTQPAALAIILYLALLLLLAAVAEQGPLMALPGVLEVVLAALLVTKQVAQETLQMYRRRKEITAGTPLMLVAHIYKAVVAVLAARGSMLPQVPTNQVMAGLAQHPVFLVLA
jgi:hypothetical protein